MIEISNGTRDKLVRLLRRLNSDRETQRKATLLAKELDGKMSFARAPALAVGRLSDFAEAQI